MSMYKDVQGRYRTKSLFYEQSSPEMRDKYEVPFTLTEVDKERDGRIYLSLKRIYLKYKDPTEYMFATEVLGSYEAWQALKRSTFFKAHAAAWKEEVALLLQAEGIMAIREEVAANGKGAATGAKWLAEKGWDRQSKKGRPSNDKVRAEAARMRGVDTELDEFLEHADNVHYLDGEGKKAK